MLKRSFGMLGPGLFVPVEANLAVLALFDEFAKVFVLKYDLLHSLGQARAKARLLVAGLHNLAVRNRLGLAERRTAAA